MIAHDAASSPRSRCQSSKSGCCWYHAASSPRSRWMPKLKEWLLLVSCSIIAEEQMPKLKEWLLLVSCSIIAEEQMPKLKEWLLLVSVVVPGRWHALRRQGHNRTGSLGHAHTSNAKTMHQGQNSCAAASMHARRLYQAASEVHPCAPST